MSYVVYATPDSTFAVYATDVDSFIMWDATAHDVTAMFVKEAAERAQEHAAHVLERAKEGKPRTKRRSFAQALAWTRAVAFDEDNTLVPMVRNLEKLLSAEQREEYLHELRGLLRGTPERDTALFANCLQVEATDA